jgi:23S rRNA (uridine2479-2'-O)-methyltransferase
MSRTTTPLQRISSRDSTFQLLETFKRNRQKRHRARLFFVEGVRSINLAIQNGWGIDAFAYCAQHRLSDWARGVLQKGAARVHYELTGALMTELSDKEEPSELVAVVAMRADNMARIPATPDLLLVACDQPSNPGNLGTIIRSCDAFGGSGVAVTGHAADLYDPQTIRATTGSFFSVPSVRLESYKELQAWAGEQRSRLPGLQVVGTSAKAGTELAALDLRKPTVLLVGNETRGLSQPLKQACDTCVRIPIRGTATSLNVACATSVMLYEVARQRGTQP